MRLGEAMKQTGIIDNLLASAKRFKVAAGGPGSGRHKEILEKFGYKKKISTLSGHTRYKHSNGSEVHVNDHDGSWTWTKGNDNTPKYSVVQDQHLKGSNPEKKLSTFLKQIHAGGPGSGPHPGDVAKSFGYKKTKGNLSGHTRYVHKNGSEIQVHDKSGAWTYVKGKNAQGPSVIQDHHLTGKDPGSKLSSFLNKKK